jgi:protein SCO1/2
MWTNLYRIGVVSLVVPLAFAITSPRVTEAQQRPGGREEAYHTAHPDHQHHQQTPALEQYSRSVGSYDPPDVMLVDMTGAEVALSSVLNHTGPVLLQFIFTTCPTVCPVLSEVFAAAQAALGPELDNVRMVSISIDPEHDTPARLQEYAQRFRAKQQWRFLTGKREDIVAVQTAFEAYWTNKMRHEPRTYIRAALDAPWVRLDGFMSATELVAEYYRLLGK